MMGEKTTFALYFGNRGFFPEKLIASARQELCAVLDKLGHKSLMLAADATRYGAVETPAEGEVYAKFLRAHAAEIDGVILCLPNFGDETGAIAALQDAGVPILVQAYPDQISQMGFADRRDAFCGKFSIMDVFNQYGVKFSAYQPHTVHPESAQFADQIDRFDRVCRVVKAMRRMSVGAIGARTTAFKTVRFDELTLQNYGITCETLDLSELFQRVRDISTSSAAFLAKADRLQCYTNWDQVPAEKFTNLTKISVALDQIIADYGMDCLALRCWIELEKEFGVAPCVLLSELNDRGIAAACELDVCNAVVMHALQAASGNAATCLDWNNNWGDDPDKCVLFHCGPVPQQLMTSKGQVVDHPMFAKAMGAGCGFGCNVGRIAAAPLTYASALTRDGKLCYYVGEGRFTDDQLPDEYFGCAGVTQIPNLQQTLQCIGYAGYRHHVSVTTGHVATAVQEAFDRYLGYERTVTA